MWYPSLHDSKQWLAC